MKKTFILAIVSIVLLFVSNALAWEVRGRQGKLLKNLEEFHKRNGLPNVFNKIEGLRQVNIAYLGGSITSSENGWRDLTFNWFRLNFPHTTFYQKNAAIGGTGSNLGVFRVERDVLKFKPDLIFIEFAVNDGDQTREGILCSMEGIIRKCRKENPYIDLCFVYTAKEKHIEGLVEGKLHSSVLVMEELADYYGIPSIHMGIEVARLFADKKLIITGNPKKNKNTIVFTRDGVHPITESGHPLYASVVTKYLHKMQSGKRMFEHRLPKPYIDNNWENAQIMDLSNAEKIGDWEKMLPDLEYIQKFSKFIPDIYKAAPGSKLRFNFKGKYLALYDLIGPETGRIKVSIDGKEQIVDRFDSYCTFYRLGIKMLADDLEETEHTVEVTVLNVKFDKESMIRADRIPEYHANPEIFKEINWFAGYFLILE